MIHLSVFMTEEKKKGGKKGKERIIHLPFGKTKGSDCDL